MRRLGPPKTRRSPERSSRSVNGPVRRSTPASRNRQRVAEADRHDRRGRRFLAVLVQPEPGAGTVEVDDRRVGGVGGAGGGSERVVDRLPGEIHELRRQRLDRGAVGVVRRARVGVRLPVPAEADRLHAHQVARRNPGVSQTRGRLRPRPEVRGEPPLASGVEPPGDVHDTGQHVAPYGSICAAEIEAELAAALVAGGREHRGDAAQAAASHPSASCRFDRRHTMSTSPGRRS